MVHDAYSVTPRWVKLERGFAIAMSLFFVYTLLVWRGVLGDGSAWRPGQSVLLSAALLLQAVAALVRRRSPLAFYGLMAASLALLYFSIRAR